MTQEEIWQAIQKGDPGYAQGEIQGERVSIVTSPPFESRSVTGTVDPAAKFDQIAGQIIDGIVLGKDGFGWTRAGLRRDEFEARANAYYWWDLLYKPVDKQGNPIEHREMAQKIRAYMVNHYGH